MIAKITNLDHQDRQQEVVRVKDLTVDDLTTVRAHEVDLSSEKEVVADVSHIHVVDLEAGVVAIPDVRTGVLRHQEGIVTLDQDRIPDHDLDLGHILDIRVNVTAIGAIITMTEIKETLTLVHVQEVRHISERLAIISQKIKIDHPITLRHPLQCGWRMCKQKMLTRAIQAKI